MFYLRTDLLNKRNEYMYVALLSVDPCIRHDDMSGVDIDRYLRIFPLFYSMLEPSCCLFLQLIKLCHGCRL